MLNVAIGVYVKHKYKLPICNQMFKYLLSVFVATQLFLKMKSLFI